MPSLLKPVAVKVLVAFGCIVACLAFLAYTIIGTDSTVPHPSPPKEAQRVNFFEHSGFQSWEYMYGFDAPAEVCEEFAVNLMKNQSIWGTKCVIARTPFHEFPITTKFPAWFDVSNVQDGILLTGDNWIFAVVDKGRHRLYYYNSH
jgi:hypothetical protein